MSTTAALLTVDQFLAMAEDETVRQELIGGEIVAMGRGGPLHEIVKSNFSQEFGFHLKQSPVGRAMTETTFRLSEHDSLMPDVSVVLAGRFDPRRPGLIPVCPDIAIEVVSSEPAAVLRAKIQLYLQHGAKAVWVAYPELRMIQVYDASGVRELSGDQRLEAPEVLPGFSVPAAAFFEGI